MTTISITYAAERRLGLSDASLDPSTPYAAEPRLGLSDKQSSYPPVLRRRHIGSSDPTVYARYTPQASPPDCATTMFDNTTPSLHTRCPFVGCASDALQDLRLEGAVTPWRAGTI